MSDDVEITNVIKSTTKIISVVAAANSILLLFIFFRCPLKRVHNYRYFFLMTAIQDLVLAACCIFLSPITIARNAAAVFLATGMFRGPPLGEPLLLIFCTVFIFSLLIITNSFIYRYIHLCKRDFTFLFESKKWIPLVIFINLLTVINWFALLIFGGSHDQLFVAKMNEIALQEAGVNLNSTAFIGFNVRIGRYMNAVTQLILLCENWFMVFGLLAITCFCAIQITCTLRKVTLNKQVRRHHRQMFLLLLLQTAAPMLFMYAPLGFMYMMLFSGTQSTVAMSSVIATLFAIYPVIDPLIPVFFLREYREFILPKICHGKPPKKSLRSIRSTMPFT